MSIIPLAGYMKMGIGYFEITVPVQDVEYPLISGEQRQRLLPPRTLQGAVDATSGRHMERLFGGGVSDGDISIITQDHMFIADIYPVGTIPKQSFVAYGEFQYRIEQVSDWTPQLGTRVYLGKRHVTQDLV